MSFFLSLLLAASASSRPELNAIAAEAFPADRPGAAVIVVKNGDVLLREGYGLADIELAVPIEPDMVFRLGSVTKQFTAAAILRLEEAGKLAVQDDIRKHLPDYPTGGRTITIEHLLTHTSGVRSYTDMDAFGARMRDDMAPDELIDVFKDEPLAFEPGEKYAYNNSGYALLGAIIEAASGMSYQAFLETHVFEPLGMTQSYYGSAERIIPRRARGYAETENGSGFVNASYLSMTLPYAAGSLLSTVDDLARYDAALYSSDVLSQASLDKWWKPFHLNDGTSAHYAYGWRTGSYQGRTVVGHGGGINGFTCYMLRIPEERLFVSVLTNRNARRPTPTYVARKLAAAAIGHPLPEPTPVSIAPGVLEAHSGIYRVGDRARHEVTLEDGKLYLRRFGDEHPEGGRIRNPGPSEGLNRERVELLPISDNQFLVAGSVLEARFEPDALVVESWGISERAEKTAHPTADEPAVLLAIQTLFDGMSSGDGAAMRSVLDRNAHIVQTGDAVRSMSARDFVSRVTSHDGPTLVEKTWDPNVRIEDHLATVWLSYAFYVGETLDHCGEDTFQLAKSSGRWRIIAIADTQRREGCTDGSKE